MFDFDVIGVPSILRLTCVTVSLSPDDVHDFRFDLGVERNTEEMEHVLVCLCKV